LTSSSALYERLIERDLPGIRAAVREFRASNSSDDLFTAVARFAVLAYAPSQHAKHAVLAMVAAHELKAAFAERWDDLLTECAIYAAQSRQPWREAPILEPPEAGEDGSIDELREAAAAQDRLRAERWLARRIDDPDLPCDYFLVASDDFEDLGHKLIVAVAAWKLAAIVGEKGRFAALRIGVWEMCAYSGRAALKGPEADCASLLNALIAACAEEHGSIESAHRVFLLDAAIEAVELTRKSLVLDRACSHLRNGGPASAAVEAPAEASAPFAYALARDYAGHLKSRAVAQRLRAEFSAAPLDAFVAATRYNLDHAPSFEEWSFA
jgi:hypothetical protein